MKVGRVLCALAMLAAAAVNAQSSLELASGSSSSSSNPNPVALPAMMTMMALPIKHEEGEPESAKELFTEPVLGQQQQFYPLPVLSSWATPKMNFHQSGKTAKLVTGKTPPAPADVDNRSPAPVVSGKLAESTKWSRIEKPAMARHRVMRTIKLKPIVQTYNVFSNKFEQEFIKKPVVEPVVQPYVQPFVQQAQPILQPVLQQITQPIVHRQLQPELTSRIEKASDLPTLVKPKEINTFTNKPILGTNLEAKPMSKKAHGSEKQGIIAAPAPKPILTAKPKSHPIVAPKPILATTAKPKSHGSQAITAAKVLAPGAKDDKDATKDAKDAKATTATTTSMA